MEEDRCVWCLVFGSGWTALGYIDPDNKKNNKNRKHNVSLVSKQGYQDIF